MGSFEFGTKPNPFAGASLDMKREIPGLRKDHIRPAWPGIEKTIHLIRHPFHA
jgi:hypothetical protein